MRIKKILTIIIVSSMLLLLSWQNQMVVNTRASVQNSFLPVLNADPMIVIDEDSDFSIYPGYGNESHPYIISGFDIEVPTDDDMGINITGTTMHFEIRNNDLSAITVGYIAISIVDVAPNTAKVSDNYIQGFGAGIYGENAEGIIIEENTCTWISDTIFRLINSPHARIEKNNMYNINPPELRERNSIESSLQESLELLFFGMYLERCSDSNITGNYMDFDKNFVVYGTGITVFYSDRVLIDENIVRNIRIEASSYEYLEVGGIYLNDVSYATIYNNTVEKTDKTALYALSCDNLLISNNTLNESEIHRISLSLTTNSNITYNVIKLHPDFGITMDSGSSNNIVHHNYFIDNNIGGSQASDSGSSNIWYDPVTLQGNWWNDWTGGDYLIGGSAGSLEVYPLGEPIVVPEFSQQQSITYISLLVSAIILTSTIIWKKKKK
jgi:parallel beta-helix repeat protein